MSYAIKIENGHFLGTNKKRIYYNQIISVRNNLIYCVTDAWNVLLQMYGKQLKPFLFDKSDLHKLKTELSI